MLLQLAATLRSPTSRFLAVLSRWVCRGGRRYPVDGKWYGIHEFAISSSYLYDGLFPSPMLYTVSVFSCSTREIGDANGWVFDSTALKAVVRGSGPDWPMDKESMETSESPAERKACSTRIYRPKRWKKFEQVRRYLLRC